MYVFTEVAISSKSRITGAIVAPYCVGACRICVAGFVGWKRLCLTLIHVFTLFAVPAVPFLAGALPKGRQVGTVCSCFVAVMSVFFTFIDIYAGEAVPPEPLVTFADVAPVHVTTDRVFTAFTLVVIADFALFAGKLAPNLHHRSLVFTYVEMRLEVLAIWRSVVIALDQDIFRSRLAHT